MTDEYLDDAGHFTKSEVEELKRLAMASKIVHHVVVGIAALVGLVAAVIGAVHAVYEIVKDAK
jgi:rRNA processing protein Gar1